MQMLDEHVVLITGGGSGLGLGVARHCRAEGAELAILEIDQAKVEDLKREFGDEVLVLQGDVRSVDDLRACRDAIVERFGRLDALIGMQGVFDGNVPLADVPSERIDELFDELFHINVKGYIHSARMFVELLRASSGAIVLTTSVAAYHADGGGLFYTATKGAIRSMVHQLAFELAPDVRVSGVAPGVFAKSQMRGPQALGLEEQKQSDIPEDVFAGMVRRLNLIEELPAAEDYGPLYAFLASRHNTVMTGQTVLADEGVSNRAVITAPANEPTWAKAPGSEA